MPPVDVLPGRLDVRFHPGNGVALEFDWPEDLTGRTFTANVAGTALTVAVNTVTDTVTVSATEAQTILLPAAAPWSLVETTGGLTEEVITGRFLASSNGTASPDGTVTVSVDAAAVTVTVLGPPGPSGAAGTIEDAQDAIGQILTDSATIDFAYDDTVPSITAIVKLASLGTGHLNFDPATQAELDAEATTRASADTALDARLDAIEVLGSLATDAELGAEASARLSADNALDARLDAIEASTRDAVVVVASDADAFWTPLADYVCDGTNDEATINTAVAAAAVSGRSVMLSDGTFDWDADIAAWDVEVPLIGQGGRDAKTTIALGAGVANGPRWAGTKTKIGADNVFSTVAAGATSLTMATDQTANLVAGDWIMLSSGAFFSTRSFYNVGEWNRVKSITATTLTLAWPTRHAYSTGDTLHLYRYRLLDKVELRGIRLLGNPASTQRAIASTLSYCYAPVVDDVLAEGDDLYIGVDVAECVNARADIYASRVLDLNVDDSAPTGYGVRCLGTLDADVTVIADDCRHAFDDSSLSRRPPSLRTRVRGVARTCRAAGWSTHGGSDECFFDDVVAVNCGGGGIHRGRALRGRIIVQGTQSPASNEYTTLGLGNQSTKHGLWVGEANSGGAVTPAGQRLRVAVDMDLTGAPSATHAVLFQAEVALADVVVDVERIAGHTAQAISFVGTTIRNTVIRGGTIKTPTATDRVIEIAPASGDGNNQLGLRFEGIDFDGYGNACISVNGNSADSANASDRIVMRGCRARNKQAAYSSSGSLWRLNSGWFSTTAGAVRIQDNEGREFVGSTAGVVHSAVNGGAGAGTGLTAKGNLHSAGYDTAP